MYIPTYLHTYMCIKGPAAGGSPPGPSAGGQSPPLSFFGGHPSHLPPRPLCMRPAPQAPTQQRPSPCSPSLGSSAGSPLLPAPTKRCVLPCRTHPCCMIPLSSFGAGFAKMSGCLGNVIGLMRRRHNVIFIYIYIYTYVYIYTYIYIYIYMYI